MDKKVFKYGFTLAEMMVCLSVIAVIATILIPTLGELRPNKAKTMFKKAYQITERTVYELVNDNVLYPEAAGVVGFDNVGEVKLNNGVYGSDYIADPSKQDEDMASKAETKVKSKFCQLFADKLNIIGKPKCESIGENEFDESNNSFITTDGIVWALPYTNFTASSDENEPAWKMIMVDVNGAKAPNTWDLEDDNAVCDENTDRFKIYVRADGLMAVKGVCAREFIYSSNLIKGNSSGMSNSALSDGGGSLVNVDADGTTHHASSDAPADGEVNQEGSGSSNLPTD